MRDMTIKRLDHLSVVVDDLAVAIAFFTGLGMTLEGEMPVEGPWVDRVRRLQACGRLLSASTGSKVSRATSL
jgi:catechol 2,3-dioxygenase-like lactoylglutathione lyase family enzyme